MLFVRGVKSKGWSRIFRGLAMVSAVGITALYSAPHSLAAIGSSSIHVSKQDFGVNTFAWDSQLASAGAKTALSQLGVGMQQFPNSVNWDWATGEAVDNPQNPSNPGASPVSLGMWGRILQSTGQSGLFIFNYDQAPGWTSGGTAADATRLANYILENKLPISAIVIGDEEYGQWDFTNNLHQDKSAMRYAENAADIAQAIKAVLPSVKVGVSFQDGTSAHAIQWDQDVLRLDAPYIDFLSVHSYPFSSSMSPSDILHKIPQVTQQMMATAESQIEENVSPGIADRLAVWITEWNPESLPNSLSMTQTYGAMMVESIAAWKSSGAHRVFIWSFGGGQDSSTSNGTFSLVSDGKFGSLPENALYPSGEAVAEFLNSVGASGTMQTLYGPTGFVASVIGSQTKSYFINTTSATQTYQYNGNQTVSVAPDSMSIVNAQVISVTNMSGYMPTAGQPSGMGPEPLPTVTSVPRSVYPGEMVTISGQNLGSTPGYIHLYQGTLDWGTSTAGGTSWGSPGNWYTVKTVSWSPSAVTFQVPNDTPAPNGLYYKAPTVGKPTVLSLVTGGGVISNSSPVQVTESPAPHLEAYTGSIYPGELITLKGVGLGAQTQGAYLQITDGQVSWGAPGNSYGVKISTWGDQQITFQVPNGQNGTGIALPQGTAQIRLVSSAGASSNVLDLPVAQYGLSISGVSSQNVSRGASVTLTGKGFGAVPGYVQLQQGSVSWGAPGNAYGVKVVSWSDSQITILIPDGQNAPGAPVGKGPVNLNVVTADGVQCTPVALQIS